MRSIPAAILLSLAITACGGTETYNSGDNNRRAPVADNDRNTTPVEPRLQDEEPDEWAEDYGYQDGEISVLDASFVGQVGSYLFDDGDARASGYYYSDGDYSSTSIDSRTTLDNGKAVMVLLTIDGPLDDASLSESQTFNWDSWGTGPVYATALGCTGEEDVWLEYDVPADEVEIVIVEDPEQDGVLIASYIARWQNEDPNGDMLEVKGQTRFLRP